MYKYALKQFTKKTSCSPLQKLNVGSIPFSPRHWINIYFLRNSEKQTAAGDLFPIEVIRILQPMQKLHRVKTALYVRCCHLDRLLFLGDQLVLCIWENSIYLIKSPRPTEQWTGSFWTAFWRDIFKTIDIFWRLNLNEKSLVITLYWILISVYRARAGCLLYFFNFHNNGMKIFLHFYELWKQ